MPERRAAPAWAYFDTSALIQRYVEEPGRRPVVQLLRRDACVTSAVLPIEIQSALRRRVAEGTIEAADVAGIQKRVANDRAYWTLVDVGREALVAAYPLRALDAIHVASAHVLATRLAPAPVTFVSADARQTAAASALGMITTHIGT